MKKSDKNPHLNVVETKRGCKVYAMFTNLKGYNRDVNKAHVDELAETMEKFGFIGYITILRTKAFGGVELIKADGQHRIAAAEKLGIPFNYEILELANDTQENVMKFIAALNSTSKGWVTANYTNGFSKVDTREYRVFDTCLKNAKEAGLKLTVTDLQYIFLNGAGKEQTKAFKEGTMKFANEKESMRLFENVKKMYPNLPKKSFSRRSVYRMLSTVKFPNVLIGEILKHDLTHLESETALKAQLQNLYEKATK